MSNTAPRGFRADINGLRAWAVLAVILFHFNVPGFSGGYIGVDVFFVISGFLMTGIIARALRDGAAATPFTFLWNFFLARGKRIWPALIVLCGVMFVVGWFCMSAEEFGAYGEQARSAVLFVSNVKFWREAGYFAPGAHAIWLLHTWSLSVEWQFYVLLPVAMLATWKIFPSPRALLFLLVAGGLASLALCLYIAAQKPGTAFFLLPCRAWEMIAGGVVALTSARPPRSAQLRQALEIGGLALIVYAALTFGQQVWPNWRALVPVVGTVMVLLSAKENSLLTNWAPLRWVGERSYSMYLWHWPLVVGIYYFGDHTNGPQSVGGLVLTAALGHLSYVLVETRMRRPLDAMPRGAGSLVLAAACAAIVLPGTVIAMMAGVPARLPADVRQMFAVAGEKEERLPGCDILKHGDDRGCAAGGARLGAVVIGDSHAIAMFDAVRSALPADTQVLRWAMPGCGTMMNMHSVSNPSFECDRFMTWVMRRLASVPSTVPVIIISRSSFYTEGPNEDQLNGEAGPPNVYFNQPYPTRSPQFYQEMRKNMIDTACTIARDHKVVMMRPTAEMLLNVPGTLGHAMLLGNGRRISVSMGDYVKRHAVAWEAQDAARAQCGITLLDPRPYLCSADGCDAVRDRKSLYFDDDHLSSFGAAQLTPMFAAALAAGGIPPPDLRSASTPARQSANAP